MVYLLSRSPFSSPPLLADRVGVAVGVAGFISLLLAGPSATAKIAGKKQNRQRVVRDNRTYRRYVLRRLPFRSRPGGKTGSGDDFG